MLENEVKDILFVIETDEKLVKKIMKLEKGLRREKVFGAVAIGVAVAVEIQLSILEAKLENAKESSKDQEVR